MKIGICNDHAGVEYKFKLIGMLQKRGIEVVNYGTDTTVSVDYPDYAHRLASAVESGEVDANYFQHTPYLNNFNEENKTHLVVVSGIHVEPIGLYGGKQSTLDALK